ncbi:ABC transporter substrate-binding protein [Gilvimarinus sp. F26214L]|uniref:ABC transporter substrate-binding protein n=1 Tax=Gilvimarinus sp. DZF01 TaxID=3461371 RepID=UPI004045E0FD
MKLRPGFGRWISIFALCLSVVAAVAARAESWSDSTLRVAMSTLHEETFLPWMGGGGRKVYLDTIYEYLAYVDPQTHALQPGLATDWNVSPDGKVWTLNIRRGVEFHHGWGEVTAKDVKYSLERLIDPSAVSGPSSSMRNIIEDVAVAGEYQVVIRLKRPDIAFVQGYLSNAMQAMIVSRRYVEEVGERAANRKPVGTGPYVLDAYRSGVSVTVKTVVDVDNHWRSRPDFERVRFLAVPEESTRIAMLRAGEVDLAPVAFDSVAGLKRYGINIISISNSWSPIIRFGGLVETATEFYNPKVPWQSKKVRQAMNYAVDKETILEAIFHGEGRVAGTDFPAQVFFDIPPYPYDPERAKALMKEAGYEDGFSVTLKTFTTTPGAELPIIGEIVGMYWEAIGIDVHIVPIDWITQRTAQVNGKATGFVWTHRGIAFPTPLVGLQASYSSDSVFATFANEETESRLEAIENTLNPEEREQLIREMGQLIREEATGLFLIFSNEPYGASDRIESWPSLSQHVTNVDLIKRRVAP